MPIAFALREDYAGTVEVDGAEVPVFTGGLLAVADRDVDVRAELDAGAGIIVVADHDAALAEALAAYPALKRVAVPDGSDPVEPYVGLTVPELRAELKLRELTVDANARRDDLVTALLEHDSALAAGVDATDPDSTPEA